METILRILAWAIQIGITVLIAMAIGWLLKKAEEAIRRKRGHLLPWTLTVFAVLCAILAALALNPPVICPDEYEDALTSELRATVQSNSRGLYSDNIPLVPAYVKIHRIQEFEVDGEAEQDVYYYVKYLYFGQIGMTFSTVDGFNLEEQLSGLQ